MTSQNDFFRCVRILCSNDIVELHLTYVAKAPVSRDTFCMTDCLRGVAQWWHLIQDKLQKHRVMDFTKH